MKVFIISYMIIFEKQMHMNNIETPPFQLTRSRVKLGSPSEQNMEVLSTQSFTPSFMVPGSVILEQLSEVFSPYMGVAAILVIQTISKLSFPYPMEAVYVIWLSWAQKFGDVRKCRQTMMMDDWALLDNQIALWAF